MYPTTLRRAKVNAAKAIIITAGCVRNEIKDSVSLADFEREAPAPVTSETVATVLPSQ